MMTGFAEQNDEMVVSSELAAASFQADSEAQRLRRIMSNRESARRTIRRRKALHLNLIKETTYLTAENENLKKEKELMLEEYNSLKHRNTILKAQVAKNDKHEQDEVEAKSYDNPETSTSSSAVHTRGTPHDHPTLIPCFWPSVPPSSSAFQFPYTSHHPDIITSSSSSHQGQEMGIPGPFYLVPLPWLIPFLAQSNTMVRHTYGGQSEMKSETRKCRSCLSLDKMRRDVYTTDELSRGLDKMSRDQVCKKLKDACVATEARRRRKEVLELKNIRSQYHV